VRNDYFYYGVPTHYSSAYSIHEIGPDYLLGVSRTALDTEVVELYRVNRHR